MKINANRVPTLLHSWKPYRNSINFVLFRDAAWETEENAFRELMERPNRCNAENCICIDGRESDKPSNELIICETCGSSCIHKKCWKRREPYFCCHRVDSDHSRPRRASMMKKNITEQKDENNMKIRSKRKREHQTDDEKLDEKRRKKRKMEKFTENQTTPQTATEGCGRKVWRCKTISDFPITRIRNGTFEQFLNSNPRVLLHPVSLDQLDQLKNSTKRFIHHNHSNRSLVTSNIDNSLSKEDEKSSSFTVISPKRKSGGKSFKNYTITSFFKPYLSKEWNV